MKNILDENFRPNPSYELVLFDHLPLEQQNILKDLKKDPDFYGILRPRNNSEVGIKSVCLDTALLYLTLQKPGKLPDFVQSKFGEASNEAVAELVLDGVLEVEKNGTFVSGADAHEIIYGDSLFTTGTGIIARQSLEALRYAQTLGINESARLSARMYFYGRIPLSPHWRRMFPTPLAVVKHLGVEKNGSNRALSDQYWSEVSIAPPYDGWYMWKSRDQRSSSEKVDYTYKLYVSPRPEFIREAFQAALEELSSLHAPQFKIGKDAYGLLRTDKFIVYFWSFDALHEAKERLLCRLKGCPAHGVPFTAELSEDGLLSWGMDPPLKQQVFAWQERESWRLWVTNRLAAALVKAKASPSKLIEPWQFALERLHLDGVDTQTWTPNPKLWMENFSNEK